MKRTLAAAVTAALLITGAISAVPSAQAAQVKHTKFKNCTAMHKKYPGGIAKTKHARNTKTVAGKKVLAFSHYKPKVSKKLYNANKSLDRDKDGIACEA